MLKKKKLQDYYTIYLNSLLYMEEIKGLLQLPYVPIKVMWQLIRWLDQLICAACGRGALPSLACTLSSL